jgi:hypothetical protein
VAGKHILVISILLANVELIAQNDTIFTKSNKTIACHILRVGQMSVEYSDSLGLDKFMDLYSISFYSKNGTRTIGKSRSGFESIKKIDSVNVSEELNYMRFCFTKFNQQYTTGLSITLVGAALGGSSFFITKDKTFREEIGLGGLVVFLVGFGCSLDAHKWIGRAGWGVSGKGNMVEVRYRFK